MYYFTRIFQLNQTENDDFCIKPWSFVCTQRYIFQKYWKIKFRKERNANLMGRGCMLRLSQLLWGIIGVRKTLWLNVQPPCFSIPSTECSSWFWHFPDTITFEMCLEGISQYSGFHHFPILLSTDGNLLSRFMKYKLTESRRDMLWFLLPWTHVKLNNTVSRRSRHKPPRAFVSKISQPLLKFHDWLFKFVSR